MAGCGLHEGTPDNRIVPLAAILAIGVNTDGRREVLGLGLRLSEAETFWNEILRSFTCRGLRGVKLAISDARLGLKAASKVLDATFQCRRVHCMTNPLACLGKAHQTMVAPPSASPLPRSLPRRRMSSGVGWPTACGRAFPSWQR